ncbi:UV radiation resistance-associated gene protein isoform X2 [Cryptotermes secundus]|nr:UV radiation resistance-associated gene protein isoform X2 [Cryptotermes secundus]
MNRKLKAEVMKASFYYTLHLTTMSAPFYTSEKLESSNPKWAEIEIRDLTCHVNTAVNGIVIRMWLHREGEPDHVITVWGVYFSGLLYLGPKLSLDPAVLKLNTIVFHMHGGYFTAFESFKETPLKIRNTTVTVSAADAQPSYNVNLLLRLHTIQQVIKKQVLAAQNLREKISVGGFTTSESRENAVLRCLLNKSHPKAPERQELLRVRKDMELVRFRVSMLSYEKSRKQAEVRQLEKMKSTLYETNQDRGMQLMDRYQNLHKDMEHVKEWKRNFVDMREAFLLTGAQLSSRQKQLISELNLIYPIVQMPDNKYTICGVHLPNSEDFAGSDEVMISVALGFVAHLVQMISIFLQVPLRYPVIHFGSRSKIVDHVVEKIPDKDREFPLFSRGKDKLQFNYGVYLLNKNIAQLRWYFNLPTQDLRATLPNLTALLHFWPGPNMLETHHCTLSGSSLDLRSSSQNASPVGSLQVGGFRRQPPGGITQHFEKGHRVCKSMGNSELGVQMKTSNLDMQSVNDFTVAVASSNGVVTSLSYSLDKGLDEYEEIKKAQNTLWLTEANIMKQQRAVRNLAHVGSEPILTQNLHKMIIRRDHDTASSSDEAQRWFLQNWQAHGPAPICSDDDTDVLHNPTALSDQSSSNVYMGMNKSKEDNMQQNGLNIDVMQMRPQSEGDGSSFIWDHSALGENSSPLPTVHDTTNTEDSPCVNVNNTHWKPNITQTANKDNTENGGTVIPEDSWCVQELVTLQSLQTQSSAGGQDINALNSSSMLHVVIPDNSSISASLKNGKEVGPVEDSVFTGASVVREGCYEAMGMKHLSCEGNSELEKLVGFRSILESPIVDSVLTRRTEALARRTASFNLVRTRHNSSLEDGSP